MDLKELGDAMVQALALRGMIDSLDEKLSSADAQIAANRLEIARLKTLEEVTKRALEERNSVSAERNKQQAELDKRLSLLAEVGVKLPIKEKFSARQVSL